MVPTVVNVMSIATTTLYRQQALINAARQQLRTNGGTTAAGTAAVIAG
ncbi:hypothetical protein [Serratia fonticola]